MLKVIEMFAGLGSQTQALKNIGVEHQVVAISEVDKYVIKSYEALHGAVYNLGDITKIQELPEADLWTYSFPCTDISVAGKLAGLEQGSGTRSGLLWEVQRLLINARDSGKLPKYLLLENVKNLIGKKFKADYDKWLAFLTELGYSNYYKVLNAKHYGIPQNRERVFCVSIRGEHKPYVFPEPELLQLRLRDVLESEVESKYYISTQRALAMLNSHYQARRKSILKDSAITPTLCARDYKEPKCVVVGNLNDEKYSRMNQCSRRVHSTDGISPTVHTCSGGNTEPKIVVQERFYRQALETLEGNKCQHGDTVDAFNKKVNKSGVSPTVTTRPEGFKTAILSVVDEPVICASRGRNPDNASDRTSGIATQQRLEFNRQGTTNTITTVQKDNLVVCEERSDEGIRLFNGECTGALRAIDAGGHKRVLQVGGLYTEDSERFHRPPLEDISRTLKAGLHDAGVQLENNTAVSIRKLTPTECLRLMGWNDEQINKMRATGNSNSQLYKQAGNGIVVQVLEKIFKQLFDNSQN